MKMMAIEGVRGDLREGMEQSDEAVLAGLIVSFVLHVGAVLLERYVELYGDSARPIWGIVSKREISGDVIGRSVRGPF